VRHYYSHRRAFAPRVWPPILLSMVLAVVLVLALDWRGWTAGLVGAGVGFVLTQTRWSWWRYRHPIVRHDQWLADRRRAAPWN
jgi:O-antigen/teichoic acid export membrane protein